MAKTVLGLDLGPNSIGWALIRDDPENPANCELIDLGVRVFSEGVDAFDTGKEASRNESRRIARGMRRQIARRSRRRRLLKEALIASNLYPADLDQQAELESLDPYELRARGISQPLTAHEFGRVLLHLNQRRGFLSIRKKDRGDSEVQGMLAEMSDLRKEMEAADAESYGHFVRQRLEEDASLRIRGRHTRREWFEEEFSKLWEAQQPHHTQLLTEQLRYGVVGRQQYPRKPIPKQPGLSLVEQYGLHGILFFHRTLKPIPKEIVGLCELEPKQRRCPRSDRHAQRFRLLQEINNLRYVDPDSGEEFPLSEGQRAIVQKYLSTREKASFDQLRKKLGFLESVRFNLEQGKRAGLKGMVVDYVVAAKFGKHWHDLPEDRKDGIVRLLLDDRLDDNATLERLRTQGQLTEEEANLLIDIDLPDGYSNLSLVAIDRLLPHLEKGLIYQSSSDPTKSALHAAGYLRRDELQRRLFDQLPDPAKVNPRDCKLGEIPNPVVKRALVELKKVVNAVIREHGRPDAVHVELAREVQQGRKRRSEYTSQMRKFEAEREAAAAAIRKLNVRPTRDTVLLYRLWTQQAHECVYCGKAISQQQLLGGDADIDHILPKSRSLDDSQANKVVCHRSCNHDKGQRTPYEWLADTNSERYDAICQRALTLLRKGVKSYSWYKRFRQKELELDKFIARQLTDTGYITRAMVEYLRLLFEKDHDVLGLKGQLTAELRWHWGLETILSELADSPAWQEQNQLRDGEKNRADHRHHAIDAVVIALTNRSRLQKLSSIVKRGGARQHGEVLPEPWVEFRNDVKQRVAAVNVSHRVERKIHGALHEETVYGATEEEGVWVVRKPLADLSVSEIERIRDKTIREMVMAKLASNGIEFGRGKKPDLKKMKALLSEMTMPSKSPGQERPIKKIRILKPELTIQPLRGREGPQSYVKPGSTHHLSIFEYSANGKTKREPVFVTMLEAMKVLARRQRELSGLMKEWESQGLSTKEIKQRKRKATSEIERKHPLIAKTPPADHKTIPPDAEFIMSLSGREMVLAEWKGQQKLLIFKTAASTQGQIYFAEHTDARRSSEQAKFVATANSLIARKVTVDPLGRIRWAND